MWGMLGAGAKARFRGGVAPAALILLASVTGFALNLADQKKEYDEEKPKTIVELQQFRATTIESVHTANGKEGTATLINLNPRINAWHLLKVTWKGESQESAWHLENARPGSAVFELIPNGIEIVEGKQRFRCELFGNSNLLEQGRNSQLTYVPLCGGRIYLRNQAKGHKTALETVTEFVREKVIGGEDMIGVIHRVLEDRYQDSGELRSGGAVAGSSGERPPAALIDPQYEKQRIGPGNLGITLVKGNDSMVPGAWYPAAAEAGIYVSVMRTNLVESKILKSYPGQVSSLDNVEAASLVYLVAFDMDRFEPAFEVGTVHPRVSWSDHMIPAMKNQLLPGPDGIGTIAPLAATGLIRPDLGRKTIATFTGGYKRDHSAFKYGDLAQVNHGSHYGIIENGVVMSKLQPGLATVYVLDDGTVEMKTWTGADNAFLERVRYARQNGVPLIESAGVPGKLVARWGPGNWAGNENSRLRSIRASLAISRMHGRKFMIYAVFTDATPSAMARVFQAYQVDYAMLTDMNALEHTYMALYRRSGSALTVEHLLKGMSQLDQTADNKNVPRFLGFSDNRDFFYIMHKGDNR
jgi:hypothetical protein